MKKHYKKYTLLEKLQYYNHKYVTYGHPQAVEDHTLYKINLLSYLIETGDASLQNQAKFHRQTFINEGVSSRDLKYAENQLKKIYQKLGIK